MIKRGRITSSDRFGVTEETQKREKRTGNNLKDWTSSKLIFWHVLSSLAAITAVKTQTAQ